MVEKCSKYYGLKSTGGKDPIVVEDTDKIVCPLIISIDENFPSEFGRDYRARFCFKDFKNCEYKKLIGKTVRPPGGGGEIEG